MTGIESLNLEIICSFPKELIDRRTQRLIDQSIKELDIAKEIIQSVRKNGDKALYHYTKTLDGFKLDSSTLRITKDEIHQSYDFVDDEDIKAIEEARNRLIRVSAKTLMKLRFSDNNDGVLIQQELSPLESAGCYVPGGLAGYPSSLIMTTTPAFVAGVKRIVVCTPPSPIGKINPLILVAADICEVDEIYRIGGVQAIAALAYGTESIRPVTKIVGPGNKFVTTAKKVVSSDILIDMLAGPSELLILADETANPSYAAVDMISQAEHDPDALVILITDSFAFAEAVRNSLYEIISSVPRSDIIISAMSNNAILCVVDSIEKGIGLANIIAPEHLQVVTENSDEISMQFRTSGLVLVGQMSPVAASDYCLGTNHVLPTGGTARSYSGLSVNDFIRRYQLVTCNRDGLRKIASSVIRLATREGLHNHARAIERRFLE